MVSATTDLIVANLMATLGTAFPFPSCLVRRHLAAALAVTLSSAMVVGRFLRALLLLVLVEVRVSHASPLSRAAACGSDYEPSTSRAGNPRRAGRLWLRTR